MMSMDTLINSIRASFDRDEVKRLLIVGGDTYWFDINATSDIAPGSAILRQRLYTT